MSLLGAADLDQHFGAFGELVAYTPPGGVAQGLTAVWSDPEAFVAMRDARHGGAAQDPIRAVAEVRQAELAAPVRDAGLVRLGVAYVVRRFDPGDAGLSWRLELDRA